MQPNSKSAKILIDQIGILAVFGSSCDPRSQFFLYQWPAEHLFCFEFETPEQTSDVVRIETQVMNTGKKRPF